MHSATYMPPFVHIVFGLAGACFIILPQTCSWSNAATPLLCRRCRSIEHTTADVLFCHFFFPPLCFTVWFAFASGGTLLSFPWWHRCSTGMAAGHRCSVSGLLFLLHPLMWQGCLQKLFRHLFGWTGLKSLPSKYSFPGIAKHGQRESQMACSCWQAAWGCTEDRQITWHDDQFLGCLRGHFTFLYHLLHLPISSFFSDSENYLSGTAFPKRGQVTACRLLICSIWYEVATKQGCGFILLEIQDIHHFLTTKSLQRKVWWWFHSFPLATFCVRLATHRVTFSLNQLGNMTPCKCCFYEDSWQGIGTCCPRR